jgi:hypothetical protein
MVDIEQTGAPAPTPEQVGGDGTLAGWPYGLENLPNFTPDFWNFVKLLNNSKVEGAKQLWGNSYAMVGYIAAVTFTRILSRVDLDTVTWGIFISAAETDVIDLPMAGIIDWCEGSRIGLDAIALTRFEIGTTATFNKVLPIERLAEINAK